MRNRIDRLANANGCFGGSFGSHFFSLNDWQTRFSFLSRFTTGYRIALEFVHEAPLPVFAGCPADFST
jgi:hypothetical protein